MKISRIALATLAALTLSSQAQALELTVKGKITPPACHVAMEGGGVLTWEPIAHSKLSATEFNKLESQTATLTITCDSNTKTAFALQTERSDDSQLAGGGGYHTTGYIFGIGTDPVNNNKLGNFTMIHKAGTYDNINAERVGYGTRLQSSTTYGYKPFSGNTYAAMTEREEYTIIKNGTSTAAEASTFTYDWTITPVLNKKGLITSTQEVPFEGKAILTVRYI